MLHRFTIGLLTSLLLLVGPNRLHADFNGDYAETQWTVKSYGGDGSVDWLGDACLIDSGSFGTNSVSQADMVVRVTRSGTFHFTWVFFGGTLNGYRLARLRNNAVTGIVSQKDYAEGTGSFTATAGDLVGFRITSPLGQFPAIADISGFFAPGMEPTILVQPQTNSACLGDTTIFSVIASNAVSYQWQFKGQNIAEEVFEDLVLRAIPPANTGNYRVIVRNPLGTVTSQAVPLNIFSPAQITNPPPAALTPCAGQPVTMSIGATGTSLSYQWTRDGVPVIGATGASFTLPSVAFHQSGEYRVAVSNFCGPILSSPVQLDVRIPPTIIGQPASQSKYPGETVSFSSLLAAGSEPIQCQWRHNGTNLPGATSSTLTLSNVQATDAGLYAMTIVNGCGSTISSNAILSIASEPVGIRIRRGTGRQISIEVQGPIGRAYALEVSTDNTQWTAIQTNWLLISGSPLFHDTAEQTLRFYRVRPE